MPRKSGSSSGRPRRRKGTRPVEQYQHRDKRRPNNPPVGLVTAKTEPEQGETKTWSHDPHQDPELQWTGKLEKGSFELPTVSLHVHERIDPRTIIRSVSREPDSERQPDMFSEQRPLREAVEFYRHRDGWSNRLIAGDSLLVMNSLLQKEALAGKLQMVYVDPPYGIKYGSNFQPFADQREVRDGRDEHLPVEPETIQAFRDTWELGVHSYLSYLRERLLLVRELLHESGSVFVQIGDENVHRVALALDDIFGAENRLATISFATTSGSSTKYLPQVESYLLWYAKDKKQAKYRQLYEPLSRAEIIDLFNWDAMVELEDGSCRQPSPEERFDPDRYLPPKARIYKRTSLDSQGVSTTGRSDPYEWNGRTFSCGKNSHWSISSAGMDRLAQLGRLDAAAGQNSLRWKKYEDEVPGRRINNLWPTQMYPGDKRYVVETATKVVQRCMLMSTDPGDLVLDITCGSGTTAYVAEQWGRRWISCDTSRVALTLAKQRLMTAHFDYYRLAHPEEGIGSGLEYECVDTVSPKILAEDAPPVRVALYDRPRVERGKARVSGPFTVEAVPAPQVRGFEKVEQQEQADREQSRVQLADVESVYGFAGRAGETLRQGEWREVLLASGVQVRGGQKLRFSRVEPLRGTRHIQAEAETVWAENGGNGRGGGGGGGRTAGTCRLATAESAAGIRPGACSPGTAHGGACLAGSPGLETGHPVVLCLPV